MSTMSLSPLLWQRFFDANGAPLNGGKLFSYVAGTSTPQSTYTDSTGGTPNANPVVLDSQGYASVWVDPTLNYKFILEDSLGNVLKTVDNVTAASGGTGIPVWNTNTTYIQGAIVADSSGQGLLYVSLGGGNQGNALSNPSSWRVFAGNARTLTTNTTLIVTDDLVRSNSTSGNLTHTLPAIASTPIGKRITVKDVGTGGFTTSIKGSGTDTIDGNITYSSALAQSASATVENNGTSWDVITLGDNSVTTAKLAAGAVTQAKLAARATGTTVAAGGVAISASSGTFTTSSASLVAVTNLSVTITTTGRPVCILLISDGGNLVSEIGSTGNWNVAIFQGATKISILGVNSIIPASSIQHIDTPAAGTYTYTVQVDTSSGIMSMQDVKLVAYEL